MSRMAEQQLYIYGGYTSVTSGCTFETTSPANDNVLVTVQVTGHEDVDRTVKSVQQGRKVRAAMTAVERSHILRRTADILHERNDKLVKLETLDTGKVYSGISTVDIVTGTDVLEYYAGLIPVLEDSQIPLHETLFVYIRHEPLGVVARVDAWNYPIQIAPWKSAPALAISNAMIFRPSEVTPFTALKLAEVYNEVDLPDGVFDISPGMGTETEQYLTEHPGIAKVSFTDGVASGKKVMVSSAASSLKEVTMGLGGKSLLIVFDDADFDLAADIVMMADSLGSGQVYTNGTRVFVPTKYKIIFEQKIPTHAECTRVGNVFDSQTSFGPLVSLPHRDNVLRYIAKSKEEGARVLCGGDVLKGDGLDNGTWVAPTVFTDCRDEMTVVREEIFGPVVPLPTYESENEVIRRVNDTNHGLAADIVTADPSRTYRVIHQLEAGICWVDTWGESSAEMPVGSYRHSDIGRESGVMTPQGYAQVKSIQIEMAEFQPIF